MTRCARIAGSVAAQPPSAAPAAAQLGAATQSPPPEGVTEGQGAANPKGRYAALDALPDWGGIWFVAVPARPTASRATAAQAQGRVPRHATKRGAPRRRANDGVCRARPLELQPAGHAADHAAGAVSLRIHLRRPAGSPSTRKRGCRPARSGPTGAPTRTTPTPASWAIRSATGKAIRWWPTPSASRTSSRSTPACPHSDKFHLTERIHLDPANPDMLVNEMRMEDPDALAEPFEIAVRYRRDRYGKLLELLRS